MGGPPSFLYASKDRSGYSERHEEEETGLRVGEVEAQMAEQAKPGQWWRDILYHAHVVRRKQDIRRLVIIVMLILGTSMFLFDLSSRDFYRGAPTVVTNSDASGDVESTPKPHQGTTGPVETNGTYEKTVHSSTNTLQSFAPKEGWKKPEGFKVKALIFYGRKRTVDFLDCYLQQNMADVGGYLDEVWFMVHTDNGDDLLYLEELIAKRRPHYKVVNPGECLGFSYGCVWDPVTEDDTIFIKIDDDIVYIHPDAIPQLVHTRIKEPHPMVVSANLVNSPRTGYEHYYGGAIHPFLPDPSDKPSQPAAESWRPSEKPTYPLSQLAKIKDYKTEQITKEVIDEHLFGEGPYQGHTWLYAEGKEALWKTPMGINELRSYEEGAAVMHDAAWSSWKVSAQQQYSLLQNLEDDAMWRYHFGSAQNYPRDGPKEALKYLNDSSLLLGPGGEQLLDTGYVRYNLNFVALWGHDVKANLPIAEDDEQDFTVTIPERNQRPFVIDTRAVVAHYSFFPQIKGVQGTDLLDRWRAFANDMVCAADNQKTSFD